MDLGFRFLDCENLWMFTGACGDLFGGDFDWRFSVLIAQIGRLISC